MLSGPGRSIATALLPADSGCRGPPPDSEHPRRAELERRDAPAAPVAAEPSTKNGRLFQSPPLPKRPCFDLGQKKMLTFLASSTFWSSVILRPAIFQAPATRRSTSRLAPT